MSHFNTLVFSRTPDEVDNLLAPFNECVEPGSPYAVFEEDEDGNLDETSGKKGYWTNPNAAYDWYEFAGRWRSTLKLKEGKTGERAPLDKYDKPENDRPGYCDRALAADIDTSRNEAAYQKALRRWEIMVEGAEPTPEEKKELLFLFKPEYYLKRYGDKEFYAQYESSFLPYAFVSADGKWHSCARMGWFGCDDGSRESMEKYRAEFNAYLEEARAQGLLASMMDLHI